MFKRLLIALALVLIASPALADKIDSSSWNPITKLFSFITHASGTKQIPDYDSGSFVVSWNSTTPSTTTTTFTWSRVGKDVTLCNPVIAGTSSSTTNFSTSGGLAIVSALRPKGDDVAFFVRTTSGALQAAGRILFTAVGNIAINEDNATGSFASGSAYSVNATCGHYLVN